MSDEPDETESQEPSREGVLLLAVLVEGGLIVLALTLGWMLDNPALRSFKWDLLDALKGLAAAVPLVLVFLAMSRWPVGPVAGIKRFSEEVLRPLLWPCTVVDLLGIAVLAGLGEEMLFRGVIQGYSSRHLPSWAALILASVLFGLLHAVTTFYALLAIGAGFYLGWLWQATDNLLVPAICHAVYDSLALLYLMRGPGSDVLPPVREEDEEDVGEEEEVEEEEEEAEEEERTPLG
jgi:membrane protease YdiL (CAAX protease family)